ncbi:hypothetical protein [Mesobacillus jeotgali]|uniref:hypothetical protein n=1 Tax=Mesobacillus jeotgali TaxID=129985 RepID=UPI0009A8CDC5|nr:hypothetical protein [Mesobacillus jeotgali]
MNLHKTILFIFILGICFPVASTFTLIIKLITQQPIEPISLFVLAFGYIIMFKYNLLFHELLEKWFK